MKKREIKREYNNSIITHGDVYDAVMSQVILSLPGSDQANLLGL